MFCPEREIVSEPYQIEPNYPTKANPLCTHSYKMRQTVELRRIKWVYLHPVPCNLLPRRNPSFIVSLNVLDQLFQRRESRRSSYDTEMQSNRHHLRGTVAPFFK